MSLDKLKIIAVDNRPSQSKQFSSVRSWVRQRQAHYEREWLQNPQQFDPERDNLGREAQAQIWEMIEAHIDLSGASVVDLGCGKGVLAQKLARAGANVTACDIASNALKQIQPGRNLTLRQETLPVTELEDDAYDLVVCADVIGELPREQHRHLMAELYRVCKPKGRILLSTPLDVYSKRALTSFEYISGTEIEPVAWKIAHHGLYIRLRDLFFKNRLTQRDRYLKKLEGLSRFLMRESAASHVILLGKRRKVFPGMG